MPEFNLALRVVMTLNTAKSNTDDVEEMEKDDIGDDDIGDDGDGGDEDEALEEDEIADV